MPVILIMEALELRCTKTKKHIPLMGQPAYFEAILFSKVMKMQKADFPAISKQFIGSFPVQNSID